MTEWIKVEASYPPDDGVILVWHDGTKKMGTGSFLQAWEDGEAQWLVDWFDTVYFDADPTHWMPLPEPPAT